MVGRFPPPARIARNKCFSRSDALFGGSVRWAQQSHLWPEKTPTAARKDSARFQGWVASHSRQSAAARKCIFRNFVRAFSGLSGSPKHRESDTGVGRTSLPDWSRLAFVPEFIQMLRPDRRCSNVAASGDDLRTCSSHCMGLYCRSASELLQGHQWLFPGTGVYEHRPGASGHPHGSVQHGLQ